MPDLLVLQHTDVAGPSSFVEVLDNRTSLAPWKLVPVEAPDDVPTALDGLGGLIVMGGTMSATDPEQVPWMPQELEFLRTAVAAELPVLGVCLGAQMLAAAHGGEVSRRDRPRVGYLEVTRTPEATDPVFVGWQDGATPLYFHEDEVTRLPDDAVVTLRDADGVAGWRLGSAYAVPFHPEVDADQLATWLEHEAVSPMLEAAGVDGEALLEEGRRRERSVVPVGRALVGRFIDGAVRPYLEALATSA